MVARFLFEPMLTALAHDETGDILATVEDKDIAERLPAVDVADVEHQLSALLEIETPGLKTGDLRRLLLLLHPDLMDSGRGPGLQHQRKPGGQQGNRHGEQQQGVQQSTRTDAARAHRDELAVTGEPAQGHQQRQEKGRRQQIRHVAHDLEGEKVQHQVHAQRPDVNLLEGTQKEHARDDQHQDRDDRGEDLGRFREQIAIDDSEHDLPYRGNAAFCHAQRAQTQPEMLGQDGAQGAFGRVGCRLSSSAFDAISKVSLEISAASRMRSISARISA